MATETVPYLTEKEIRDKYKNAYDTYEQTQKDDANKLIQSANKRYDRSQRQNYINYMQNQKEMPEMLARQGITGGMSESSALRAQTNYENNYNNTEGNRSGEIAEINSALERALREYQMQADENMGNEISTNRQLQSQYEQQLAEQERQDFVGTLSGYTTTDQVDKEINRIRKYGSADEQYKIDYLLGRRAEIQSSEEQKAEEERRIREERYANTISGWNSIDGINAEIERIRKSGVDTWRIPYLRARRTELQDKAAELAAQQAAAKSSSGGGSYRSGGSSGGSSGGGSSNNSTPTTTSIAPSAVTNLVAAAQQPQYKYKPKPIPKQRKVTTNQTGTGRSITRPLTRMVK